MGRSHRHFVRNTMAHLLEGFEGVIPHYASKTRAGIQNRGRHKHSTRLQNSADFSHLYCKRINGVQKVLHSNSGIENGKLFEKCK
jgi:hypothetical protein